MHLMVHIGEVGQVEAHFSPFGDSVNLIARYMYGLRQTYHRLRNHFGCIQWCSDVTCVKWRLILFRLQIVLISAQDRCMICAEFSMAMEIVLGVPDGTLGEVGQVEARFILFGDSSNLSAR